jgi:putative ABC transport system ATP-binding protein
MGLDLHGDAGDRGARRDRAAAILAELGLGDRVDYLPANLSGGQKQRVAVARALVAEPEIVFADEPTAALDKESGANVVEMLKAMGRARGATTVMVTHDNRILDRADRIVTLEEGRIVEDTRP